MREFWAKLWSRPEVDDDLAAEIEAHVDLMTEDNIERGMSPEDARAAARRHFGNTTATRERARETWQFPRLETVLQDLRYGIRGIRRSPGFSLVILLTLALGIGATTAIFSVVYTVLLRPLPYPYSERLVWMGEATPTAQGISVTWINFQHWRKENHSFEEMAGFQLTDQTLTGRGEALLTHGAVVGSSFFRLTGWQPLDGRLFGDGDDAPDAAPVVIVSHEFWAGTLAGDRNVVGSSLVLNDKAYQVVGVLKPGQKYFSRDMDFYVPLGPMVGRTANRAQHGSIRILGLLKPGVTLAAAKADLDAIMQRLALTDPGPEDDHKAFARYLAESRTGDIRQTLIVLMGAVGLVLLLACANVASLLAVRNTARTREIAIRTAIGAGQGRLARQLLTESLVVAVVGGAVGVMLAHVCLRVMQRFGSTAIPRLTEASIDVPVLVFGAAVTALAGILAAIVPVLSAGKVDLTAGLKEGASGSGAGRRGNAVRSGLVVAEIAITLVLSFASGLLLRSLIAARNTDPGFEPQRLLALGLQLPGSRYKTDESVVRFYGQLVQDLRSEPGVASVGAANCPPLAGGCGDWWYSIADLPAPSRNDVPLTLLNMADTTYFNTIQTAMVAGRGFGDTDRAGAPRVAVVNEELTRKWWPSPQMAVGHQLKIGGPFQEGPVLEIVGVVADIRQMGLDSNPVPEVFFPFAQRVEGSMVVMIRTYGDPGALAPAVRRHVASVDRNVPVRSLRVFEESIGATLAQRRFSTLLLSAFALLAIVLAAVGIYGVLNYWVSVRQKEIAIRLAMGARRSIILAWAGSHAARLALAGIALGTFGAWGTSRWLKNLVFGVSEQDPGMLVAAGAGVLALSLFAATAPLWRAMRVDAVRNLHDA